MNITLTKTNPKDASLYALVIFNFSLLLFRMIVTASIFYGFLIWNLILAGIPFLVTFIIESNPKITQRKSLLLAFSFVWLLFLPNAPYIITDFLHFKGESSMPAWFDILLLTSFSWNGIAFGFLSIIKMQEIWETKFTSQIARLFIFGCCLLSGFGIYLGRFLRYNSWDIISNPIELITDIPMLLFELRAVGFSLGYGLFLFLSYSFFRIHAKK
ncbi:MAG TPA: DUF1361 domain-containing protein [Flavobacterium sp.]|nr:DUF1361 domain-containing protein [Flavobacterium sp.]